LTAQALVNGKEIGDSSGNSLIARKLNENSLGLIPGNAVIKEIPSRNYGLFRKAVKSHPRVPKIDPPCNWETHSYDLPYLSEHILLKPQGSLPKLIVRRQVVVKRSTDFRNLQDVFLFKTYEYIKYSSRLPVLQKRLNKRRRRGHIWYRVGKTQQPTNFRPNSNCDFVVYLQISATHFLEAAVEEASKALQVKRLDPVSLRDCLSRKI
jgi:hypothetical protein